MTNLLDFVEEVSNYLDAGYQVDDFQKAFDKVPHGRLLTKLLAHGIDGNILKWIENWLSYIGNKGLMANHQCGDMF